MVSSAFTANHLAPVSRLHPNNSYIKMEQSQECWNMHTLNHIFEQFSFNVQFESKQIFSGNLFENKRHLHIIWSFSMFNVKFIWLMKVKSEQSLIWNLLNEFYIRRSSFWIAKYCLYAVMNTNWKCSNVEQGTCGRRTHTHSGIFFVMKKKIQLNKNHWISWNFELKIAAWLHHGNAKPNNNFV